MIDRRTFVAGAVGLGAALAGLRGARAGARAAYGFGPLADDPADVFELPRGWHYSILTRTGDAMADGLRVSGKPDGMCAFPGPSGLTLIVRNHELDPDTDEGPVPPGGRAPVAYDPRGRGGTTTVVYDAKARKVVRQFQSLYGTFRNCAGGPTPWGTWISCEEDVNPRHGYPFEVVPKAMPAMTTPKPIRAMGRFRREAIAVHAKSGCVYQTEDRHRGLLYRYVPTTPGQLQAGGRLQALAIVGRPQAHTNNQDGQSIAVGKPLAVRWIDLGNPESPKDDLRFRGFAKGAARFARAEGIWAEGDQVYFCATSGGDDSDGQIWRYSAGASEGRETDGVGGTLTLFSEPNDDDLLENGDNLTMAPWGDLVVCEDGPGWQRLVGVTPDGRYYPIARNVTGFSELSGVCFAPDGKTMFVNIQHEGLTLAVWGFDPRGPRGLFRRD